MSQDLRHIAKYFNDHPEEKSKLAEKIAHDIIDELVFEPRPLIDVWRQAKRDYGELSCKAHKSSPAIVELFERFDNNDKQLPTH